MKILRKILGKKSYICYVKDNNMGNKEKLTLASEFIYSVRKVEQTYGLYFDVDRDSKDLFLLYRQGTSFGRINIGFKGNGTGLKVLDENVEHVESKGELTVDNFPSFLAETNLSKDDYEMTEAPVIAGRSIVSNLVGKLFLYMGEDPREGSNQIMVKEIGRAEMHFLPMENKKSIRLKTHRSV